MTREQHAGIIRMIDSYTSKNGTSQKKAQAALIKEGIYTKTGKLAKQYGGGKSKSGTK